MRRILYMAGAGMSALLLVTVGGLWMASYFGHSVLIHRPLEIAVGGGRLLLDARSWSGPPVGVPFWIVALHLILLVAAFYRVAGRVQYDTRRRANLCAACGYDLRATPGRCPECGTVPAKGAA